MTIARSVRPESLDGSGIALVDQWRSRAPPPLYGELRMRKQLIIWTAVAATPLGVGELGCSDNGSPMVNPSDAHYSVALTVSTPSDLPPCTVALGGAVAYVNAPSSLWACAHKHWTEIACTA